MSKTRPPDAARRRLLRSAAALAAATAAGQGVHAFPDRARPETLREALNTRHLDQLARRTLSPPAYHFVADAADDGSTKRANREAFDRIRIRPRRLVDVSRTDTRLELFGSRLNSPILLAPVGNQAMLHPEAEPGSARAAARRGHGFIASMMSNFAIADIATAGAPTWLQLYPSPNRAFLHKLMRDAEDAGCTALVLTVDGPVRGNHEASRWFALHRDRGAPRTMPPLGNFLNFEGPKGVGDASFTWEDVRDLRDRTGLPLLLKGIVTAADARLCRKYGVDGLIVSNHGGRQEGSGLGTLDVLPEIAEEVGGRMPVLLDGGIRRGGDVFKALALGADAVAIGRPYLWGLAAGGQAGVEKCLAILRGEFTRAMQMAGTPALRDIGAAYVAPAPG